MEFKTYTGYETLEKDGFQVFNNEEIVKTINNFHFSTNLEEIAKSKESKDVFRTKLGDIKQIQNLNFGNLNGLLAG